MSTPGKARWLALAVVCTGSLMNVLDTTIVGVALPTIRHDLGFTQASLAWVVNSYLLTYGGFLLLGGRLGDLLGHRRTFAAAIGVFTLASLACGLAEGQGSCSQRGRFRGSAGRSRPRRRCRWWCRCSRSPTREPGPWAYSGWPRLAAAASGCWPAGSSPACCPDWILLVNVPIGAAVLLASLRVLPASAARTRGVRLDAAGAVLVTAAVMVTVYAIVGAGQAGWASARTLGTLAAQWYCWRRSPPSRRG